MKDFIQKLIPQFLLNLYHQIWPLLGAVIYGWPGKKIKVIGVTGTTGKTTVVHLITDIFEKAGYKTASISSLRFKIGDQEWKNMLKMTMPGRMKIQKLLLDAVNAGCRYVVIEVTSEGIKQARHKFIDFELAVFTNLKPEHIERHGGFENYKKAKGELFKVAKSAVINLDDENAEYFGNLCKRKKYGYSVKSSGINLKLPLTLPGDFNFYNALAAAYAGLSQGIDLAIIKQAIENFKGVPGRMEVVAKEPFTVIVDYAHTPDALEKVYKSLLKDFSSTHSRPPARLDSPSSARWAAASEARAGHEHANPALKSAEEKSFSKLSNLICVLGACGGGRDKWKRPEMGKIAAQYCDQIILTDEDPYSENSADIIESIKNGIQNSKFKIQNSTVELDRREAIKKALQLAKPNDIVIITGKGAEPLMMTKSGPIPWDDREIVRETITEIT